MTTATLGEACMLIDGRLVDSRSGRWFDNYNPYTEEALGVVADSEAADVYAAISASRRVFDESDWPSICPGARSVCANSSPRWSLHASRSVANSSPKSAPRCR